MKNRLLILPLLFITLILGCENPSTQSIKTSPVQAFGSLTIGDTADSRALPIGEIQGAKVTVSGFDFDELSAETSITEGKVQGVTIDRIPTGKNRIVTVQAATKASNITDADFINTVVMRAITDINPGKNAVSVNWNSTALANVFYELLKNDYDISNISAAQKSSIENVIDPTVHAALIDSKSIADDFKGNNLKEKADYVLNGATVTFKVNGSSFGNYTVTVTDPASKDSKVSAETITGIAAGRWNFIIMSDTGYEWYTQEITVKEGDVIDLGTIGMKTPDPEILPEQTRFTGSSEISIKSETGSVVYYTIDGSEPTTSSTVYSAPFTITTDTTVKAFAVISGLSPSDVVTKEYKLSRLGFNHPATGAFSPVDGNGAADGFGWDTLTSKPGALIDESTATFTVYSKNAEKILLEIYDKNYGKEALYDYWMEKGSDNFWRAKINGVPAGTLYAFRAWGPNWTFTDSWTRGGSSDGFVKDFDDSGNRFNPNKVLFDPYAKEISHDKSNPDALGTLDGGMYGTGADTYQGAARRNFDTGKYAPKAVVVNDSTDYGTKPKIPQEKAIIYEAHARGLTKHSSSASLTSILSGISGFENVVDIPADKQGTYAGAALMAPYLKALGVNTIELLPVHESDNDANPDNAPGGNYWAYMTYGYFAPDRRYSSDKSYGGPTKEFKEMVKAFHDAGMEVYLDVVFNHSGEGGTWYGDKDSYKTAELTFMRGLDNSTYYSLVQDKSGGYWETTGCGNNLQCDNATVRTFILDSLTYWIDEMGVDGYRFDLAPVLGREGLGTWEFKKDAQTIKDIAALGKAKDAEMIAEAWDTQWPGGYQVGNFPEGWGEWNGRFRDAIRGYVGAGNRGALNDYINGDYDNFNDQGGPQKSVNFVVAHDGFTLADLCSYEGKGNALNNTLTWPFGPSDGGNGDHNSLGFGTAPENKRQAARNYIAIQMISRGVPMIVWGDELSRTQNGNNNPYNIDSVATWNNYNMINTASPHKVATGGDGAYHNNFGTFANDSNVNGNFMFMNYMLNLRKNEPAFQQADYKVGYTFAKENGTGTLSDGDKCVWIKINGSSVSGGSDYLVFMNMHTGEVSFTIPAAASGKSWVRLVDTQNYFESDFNCWNADSTEASEVSASYGVAPWSVVILKEVKARERVADPVISSSDANAKGEFSGSANITITTATSGAEIYYTTDGSVPSAENGTKYAAALNTTSTVTVKAIAVKEGAYSSAVVEKKFVNTAAVETPVISVPEGDFWNTITVFAFSDTDGAEIHYTTDGSEPSKTSTLYNATTGIKIDNTTTLKVVAVKSGLENSQVVTATHTKQTSGAYTENKSGVMLQGFNWDSAPRGAGYNAENPNPKWYKWYGTMLESATDIKNTFEYVWFNPPSKTDTASSEGYAPTQLNDLNSCYGTEEELKAVIAAIKPAKAIADIVVNHRAGTTSWGDFTNPRWTDDYYSICSDDEGFSSASSPMFGSSQKGAADSGMGYEAYRDLDHTNAAVQQGIYSWMNSVLKRAGFVGWRYDYVKGFGGKYVGYYNAMSEAAFSVGEYWPDDGGDWSSLLNGWVTDTASTVNSVTGKKSRVFDFVLKKNLNGAFGWYKKAEDGSTPATESWDMSLLADEKNLMRSAPETAVTFVDNHDTGSTQQHWELKWDNVPVAYAFILTHPGFPCVAWQHYFTGDGWQYRGGDTVGGTGKTFKEHIDYLINLRKEVGIEYDGTAEVLSKTKTLYAAKIAGTNGEIVVAIGGDAYTPTGTGYDGNYPIYQGTNFKIWKKGEKGVAPQKVNITVTTTSDWVWSANAVMFAWVWGGSYSGGQWVKATGSGTTINFSIYDDATGFLCARCIAGTTTPDWNVKNDTAGRIYNKSNNVDFIKGTTSYEVGNFVDP